MAICTVRIFFGQFQYKLQPFSGSTQYFTNSTQWILMIVGGGAFFIILKIADFCRWARMRRKIGLNSGSKKEYLFEILWMFCEGALRWRASGRRESSVRYSRGHSARKEAVGAAMGPQSDLIRSAYSLCLSLTSPDIYMQKGRAVVSGHLCRKHASASAPSPLCYRLHRSSQQHSRLHDKDGVQLSKRPRKMSSKFPLKSMLLKKLEYCCRRRPS